ncbi:hypothetical protein [Pseudomonas sp. Leaf58]|uniref:hypothetical protein n=1 Tax=Pseudomonas sp. Leaf58 TaxID=1736226 RepID=UPI0013C3E7FC|nr:hypothetical protein [Pseudomonas sp. Leaf58]
MSDPIESSEKANPSSSAEGVQAQARPQCQPDRQAQTFTMAPEVCIDSIAELQKLLTSDGIDPSANYKITINGHTQTYPGTASELPFLLLPLWPVSAKTAKDEWVGFTLAKLEKAPLMLKLTKEILNHTSLAQCQACARKSNRCICHMALSPEHLIRPKALAESIPWSDPWCIRIMRAFLTTTLNALRRPSMPI